jgi:hypothetical protein
MYVPPPCTRDWVALGISLCLKEASENISGPVFKYRIHGRKLLYRDMAYDLVT